MRTMRVNWEDMEKERLYGGKGFWCYDEKVYSTMYNGYVVEVEHHRHIHDSGEVSGYYAVFLLRYDANHWLEETYCLNAALFTTKELWQYIAGLGLGSTSSAIQTTENQWLTMLQKALDHNCRDYFDKETNCYYFFEVDSEEYVVEIWASYCLPNGALTTMSYVGNIWADEMPIAMRRTLW